MEAVKRGGDRQELHEVIRKCSMEATAGMKNGEECDLLKRLSLEPSFGMTEEEMKDILEPQLYIGRCPEQVGRFLNAVKPMLPDAAELQTDIEL